ncbi:MAG TPA: DinB family protein [Jatrophihabitans sp.]|jgi:hypothetical protein
MGDLYPQRPEPPVAGNETATLLGALDRQRFTLAWKCSDLDAAGLRTRLAPSSITLGGLLKHLTAVEETQFQHKLFGRRPAAPWDSVDWDNDPDWEWRTAAADSPDALRAGWREAVLRSRAAVNEALEDGGLDHVCWLTTRGGEHPVLRRLITDMIEEYARHVGQADLIRESIDGSVGEDAPEDFEV